LKNFNLNWRVNNQIRASVVRVIDSDGKSVGVMKIKEALEKSRTANLDLVEVAPNADPPVVRMVELGKFRYQEEKRLKKLKKGQKGGDIKEIRFSPFIADADFNVRFGRIKEFLSEGNKVRAVVKFGGRQMDSKQFGYDLLKKIFMQLGDSVNFDMEPKFIGRHLTCVISPVKKIPEAQ
jgi:translation initiation factor IF-3